MGAVTTSVGGGLGDSANQSVAINATSYIVSDFEPSATSTYVSGGFDSLGNPYISRPVAITDVTVRVGSSGNTNVAIKPIFKTSFLTPTFINTTPIFFTGVLGVSGDGSASTESTYAYPAFANNVSQYGLRGFATGTIEYGNGGGGSIQLQRFNGRETVGAGTLSSSSSLSGSITQASIPSAPLNVNTSSITDTAANITWTGPVDDGIQNPAAYSHLNITGYRINYRNSNTESWKVLVSNMGQFGSDNLFKVVTGLSPSTYYEIQVAALNAVTDAHNPTYGVMTKHVGVRSATHSFTTAVSTHDLRVWAGTEFKKGIVKVWDGAAFLQYPNITAKVWSGTEFKNVLLSS